MGVSFSAYGVIGVKLDDLCSTKGKTTKITKYNEDTGAPYEQLVNTLQHYWCDKPVVVPDTMEIFVKEQCGLNLYPTNYLSNDADSIVGLAVGHSDEYKSLASVTAGQFSDLWIEVASKLQKSGYRGTNIKLHIIAYVSC